MEIRRQIVTNQLWHTYSGRNNCTSITIHETANQKPGAGAAAHASLLSRHGTKNSSWHYSVDDREVIQSFEDTARCWHAGDGRKSGGGNLSSIAIEICVNPDSDYLGALANAAALVRTLQSRHGIPASRIVQHNHWSGKNCPTWLRAGTQGMDWNGFLASVGGAAPVSNPVTPAKPAQPAPPAHSGLLVVDGDWGSKTTRRAQEAFGTLADGTVSNQLAYYRRRNPGLSSGWDWSGQVHDSGSSLVRAIQRQVHSRDDGHIGENTIGQMQRWLGTQIDSRVSSPSAMVRAFQTWLNEQGH